MGLKLNHYTIRTSDMDACRDFYSGVLGLAVGPRSPFQFPGYWMYQGDLGDYANAAVHIIGVPQERDGQDDRDGRNDCGGRTGIIDHVAFFAEGLAGMLAHLRSTGVPYRERTVPALGLHQVFVEDPEGVVVELNYPAAEKAAFDADRS